MEEQLSESIIDGVVTIPTIPKILAELNAAIADPDSSGSDIANIISRDPPTATKVLRLANSAYYGLRNKVTTIKHAVTMLGINVIRNLVLTATVFDAPAAGSTAGLFDRNKFWQHSLGVGVAAKIVAKETLPEAERRADEFFICGLLHDLGKLIINQHSRPKFEQALVLSQDESIPLFEAEKKIIGCTHAEVGGLLAKRWNLSDEIISSLGYHHHPAEAPEEQIMYSAATHLADIITRDKEIGSGGGSNPELQPAVWDALGLSESTFPTMLTTIDKSLIEGDLAL
ncbi:MAG: HDOD domain-containing protein [Candidatus Hydrogenedentota bacterium]|nr:MAG: HDOD domain-containing protein [Candidatus Hydrogenedentota bacterium]